MYFNFHLSGLLSDCALKKERLLIEIESSMSNMSRIHLIVMGLPLNIYRINWINTDILMNKIGMYDSGYINKKRDDKIKFNNIISINGKNNVDKKYSITPNNFSEKKPCFICEALI